VGAILMTVERKPMTVANQIIKVRRGNTAALSIALTQADGTPYDPGIGAVVKWRMARNWHSIEVLVTKTLGAGLELSPGRVLVSLDAADTDFVVGNYYHELSVQDGGDVASAMIGTVVIKAAMAVDGLVGITSPSGTIELSASVPTATH
jgi:hypothetical protein